MRPFTGLLATAILVQAVALAQPAGLWEPAPEPSTARFAVQGTIDSRYAQGGLEALRTLVSEQEASTSVGPGERQEFSAPDGVLTAWCLSAEATPTTEPVLLCEYGQTGEEPGARAILWQAEGVWQGQLYPQVPEPLADERRQLFRQLSCPAGCQERFRQARVVSGSGSLELLVVSDLGTPDAPMEEVHLLRLAGDEWGVIWAPAPGDWNWGHARVTLMQSGVNGFGVRSSSWTRQDRFAGYLAEPPEGQHRWFVERWVRTGTGYILKDQMEEPDSYGALVRLVYYLSHRYDQRARDLLDPAIALDEARTALAQRPARQGWKVERADASSFRLDRNHDGKVDLQVDFYEAAGGWVLSRLRPVTSSLPPEGQTQKEAEGEGEEAGGQQ